MLLLCLKKIIVVPIAANCTDHFQPMDLSVTKTAKEFMRTDVQKQLHDGAQQIAPVDVKMSTMKPLGACWLVSLHDHIKEHNSLILNGFKSIVRYSLLPITANIMHTFNHISTTSRMIRVVIVVFLLYNTVIRTPIMIL